MYGFLKAGAAAPMLEPGDCYFNINEIITCINIAHKQDVKILLFPSLCVTGATCGDLFKFPDFLNTALSALKRVCDITCKRSDMLVVVSLPLLINGEMCKSIVTLMNGRPLGVTPEGMSEIPGYMQLFGFNVPVGNIVYKYDKINISTALNNNAHIVLLPDAMPATVHYKDKETLVKSESHRRTCAVIYANAGMSESSSDFTFDGSAMIAEDGCILNETGRYFHGNAIAISDIDTEALLYKRMHNNTFLCGNGHWVGMPSAQKINEVSIDLTFSNTDFLFLHRKLDPHPFIPKDDEYCKEIFNIQKAALRTRLMRIGTVRTVIGVSGGLDSTLALLSAAATMDFMGEERSNIIAVTMPGYGTSGRTYKNAVALIEGIGAEFMEIPIKDACEQHFKDIGYKKTDGASAANNGVVFENAQARERTQILMDLANMHGALMLGTGDLSELALGFCTFGGDHMSMYSLNSGIPKTLIPSLIRYFAKSDDTLSEVLHDITQTPISPELLPTDEAGDITQKTENIIGPYSVNDFLLYNMLINGYSKDKLKYTARLAFETPKIDEAVEKFLVRFYANQFKRSCMPEGVDVGILSLSPRDGFRIPGDIKR